MTAAEMLTELSKSWFVLIGMSPSTNEPMVELYERHAGGHINWGGFQVRYVEPKLEHAIARAWAGEPGDG